MRRTSRKSNAKRTSRGLRRNGLFSRSPGERLILDLQMDTVESRGMKRYTRAQYVTYLLREALHHIKTAEKSYASSDGRIDMLRNALSWVIAAERMSAEAHALSRLGDANGKSYHGADALHQQYWNAYESLAQRWPLLPR